jgi:hypothetical protein
MDKVFKIVVASLIFYVINTAYNYYSDYQDTKATYQKNILDAYTDIKRLNIKYEAKENKSKEALEIKEKNQLSIKEVDTRINRSLKEINEFNGFSAKVDGIKHHNTFVNVVLAKINISLNLANFDIYDFEEEFKKQFKSYSMVMPFKYKNTKEATVYLVILKKEFDNENKK